MYVEQAADGWQVLDANDRIVHTAATNADAWRWVDRQTGDPVSRSENVAEWIWSRE